MSQFIQEQEESKAIFSFLIQKCLFAISFLDYYALSHYSSNNLDARSVKVLHNMHKVMCGEFINLHVCGFKLNDILDFRKKKTRNI